MVQSEKHNTVKMKTFLVHSGNGVDQDIKDQVAHKLRPEDIIYTIDIDVLTQTLKSFPRIGLVILLEDVSIESIPAVMHAYEYAQYCPYTLSLSTRGRRIPGCDHELVPSIALWDKTYFRQAQEENIPTT
jgi:hypothetical protein